MKLKNEVHRRLANDFKQACIEAFHDSPFNQQAIADACDTTQETISRWFGYTSEQHLPAFLLSVLPKEIAIPLLKFFADKFDYVMIARKPEMQLDGHIEDELLEIDRLQGKIIEMGMQDPKRSRKLVDKMRSVVERMDTELEGKI